MFYDPDVSRDEFAAYPICGNDDCINPENGECLICESTPDTEFAPINREDS